MITQSRVLFALVVITILVVVYFQFFAITQGKAYQILGKKNYSGLDKGYLVAWAKAVRKGESTFTFNGQTYDAQTGKAAK